MICNRDTFTGLLIFVVATLFMASSIWWMPVFVGAFL